MERDVQIKLIETLNDRRDQMVREWMSDAEIKDVLHRYDHIFDEEPVRKRVAAG
jgi:hypothetical protein